jgi:hypothetical protein
MTTETTETKPVTEPKYKHTRWLRWAEVADAALILGIVSDDSEGEMHRLHDLLSKRVKEGIVEYKKYGTKQQSRAEYCAKYVTVLVKK